uniref:Uncharacterized protein n=1 Tax=Glossina pallidipes TaxID=7398 RepID=A0A1B0ADA1_GLOPL
MEGILWLHTHCLTLKNCCSYGFTCIKSNYDSLIRNIFVTSEQVLLTKLTSRALSYFKWFKVALLQRFVFPWLIQLEQKKGGSNFKLRISQNHKNVKVYVELSRRNDFKMLLISGGERNPYERTDYQCEVI